MPSAAEQYPEAPQDESGLLMETPSMRAFGLGALRRMIAEGAAAAPPHAPPPRDDDAFLLAFLRARKYKVDKAYAVLRNFAAFWANDKYAFLHGKSVEEIRRFYEGGPAIMLEGRDREGNGLAGIHAGRMDAAFINFEAQVQLAVLGLAWLIEHEDVQLRGMTYVETFQGFTLGAAMGLRAALSSSQQKELTDLMMDTMPIRIRHIYVVKQPWYFSMVWAVAKLFFKKKITSRVELLGEDLPRLWSLVDPAAIPASLVPGGALPEGGPSFIDHVLALERAGGQLGGFAMPLNMKAPMQRAPAAVAAAAAPAS